VGSPTLLSPLTRRAVHLSIDMQRIFAPGGLWATPWMERVLPVVTEIAGRYPERTVFTRFITPERPEAMPGTWQAYYRRWHQATRNELEPHWLELIDPLSRLAPPATIIDKSRYSAFAGSILFSHLQERQADALIITGSETDVCVLSTVLDAVDFGFRVVLVRDGVCSSSDTGHDALLTVYHRRYSLQIETADAEQVLIAWER
jgi:nicotinamidase-related amidase